MEISPLYQMKLMESIEQSLWNTFNFDYKHVEIYLGKWQEKSYDNFGNVAWTDFDIVRDDDGNVDLKATLGDIEDEKLLKIAIDLGIETPGFIPMIPTFRNELKADYERASESFEKAFKAIENDPAEAIGYANSVLESIMKEILKDERMTNVNLGKKTMSSLVTEILKQFQLSPGGTDMPNEFKSIGNSLITVSKSIEKLRSDSTLFHGQETGKYVVDNPLYAYYVVNSTATVGLFLINFYQKQFPKKTGNQELVNENPFKVPPWV